MRAALCRGLVVALLLGSTSMAAAQADAIPEEVRQAAREAYGRGQTAYDEGRYEESEAAFQQAYQLIPNPVVLLGIAHAREARRDVAGAIEMYERYLRERQEPPDRAEVEAQIADLRTIPAKLTIASSPEGAMITLDGDVTGTLTPAELEVQAGEHTVALTFEGHERATQTVEAVPGGEHEVSVELTPLPDESAAFGDDEPIEEPIEDPEPVDEPTPSSSTGVWVAAGISAGTLLAGTVLGFLALGEESDFDEMPDEKTADAGERLALFADVAFGISAAAAITGLVLYFTSKDDAEDQPVEGAEVDVSPVVGRSGGGVSATVSF